MESERLNSLDRIGASLDVQCLRVMAGIQLGAIGFVNVEGKQCLLDMACRECEEVGCREDRGNLLEAVFSNHFRIIT